MTARTLPIRPGLFVWPSEAPLPSGLRGGKCPGCGSVHFPFRPNCTSCRERCELTEVELSHAGTAFEFTVVHSPAPGFQAPYRVGYVDLPEGVRLFTQFDVPAGREMAVGERVQLVIRPFHATDDAVVIGYAYAPMEERRNGT